LRFLQNNAHGLTDAQNLVHNLPPHQEKKRKDYAFRRQFNEKPSVIPGCPVLNLECVADGAFCRSIKSQTRPSSMCMMWRTASLPTLTTMILTAPSAPSAYSASSTSCLAARSFPGGLATLWVTMRCPYLQVCIAPGPAGLHCS